MGQGAYFGLNTDSVVLPLNPRFTNQSQFSSKDQGKDVMLKCLYQGSMAPPGSGYWNQVGIG